ncbi:hypothetical protein COY28_05875 [Candidatus Woesearchaeota archaeon CG_4_10_14_0_2_um_filter_57_5]|nr:MAG: hypothetical protein COY28_05875 [Candidatus Woesearchaeota archaeon CG_4_10_14_0_2_um_filter_57_5]
MSYHPPVRRTYIRTSDRWLAPPVCALFAALFIAAALLPAIHATPSDDAALNASDAALARLRVALDRQDYDSALRELENIRDISIGLCVMQTAFQAVQDMGSIYDVTYQEDKVPGAWHTLALALLRAECQGSWQFASRAFSQSLQARPSSEQRAYAEQVAGLYAEVTSQASMPYAARQSALEATRYSVTAGAMDNASRFYQIVLDYDAANNATNPGQLLDVEASICADPGCVTPYSSIPLGESYLRVSASVGGREVTPVIQGSLAGPGGTGLLSNRNPQKLLFSEPGSYTLTLIVDTDFGSYQREIPLLVAMPAEDTNAGNIAPDLRDGIILTESVAIIALLALLIFLRGASHRR